MQAAHIIPESYPDTADEVAAGATFYVNPDRYPKLEGQALLKMKSTPNPLDTIEQALVVAVRLRDGQLVHLVKSEPVRVVALVAEVSGDDW